MLAPFKHLLLQVKQWHTLSIKIYGVLKGTFEKVWYIQCLSIPYVLFG